ncbi:M13 family metallopeptidase [Mycobacterium avium]|uniref:M13 family metallopeptidase n=1 Tax=Mycobacterium avium TaxID=1764 RepID=UPI000D66E599|nr:M13 family metallopeptidase [Mycobacterium avium]
MTMASMLPSAFAELEGYAQTWCLPTETERWNARVNASMPQLRDFYDAFFPRLEEAIDYCDKFPLDSLPDDVVNLLHIIYSLIMVAMAVEIMHQPAPVDAADAVMIRTGGPVP